MIENIFGSILFEFIGAFFRWLYYRASGRKAKFIDVLNGKNKKSLKQGFEYGLSNVVLGILIVVGTIVVIMWFTI